MNFFISKQKDSRILCLTPFGRAFTLSFVRMRSSVEVARPQPGWEWPSAPLGFAPKRYATSPRIRDRVHVSAIVRVGYRNCCTAIFLLEKGLAMNHRSSLTRRGFTLI